MSQFFTSGAPPLPINELYFSTYMKKYKTNWKQWLSGEDTGIGILKGDLSFILIQLECFKNENNFQNYLYK